VNDMPRSTPFAKPDRYAIRDFFNSISGVYDFLNAFLTFGLERLWRIEFAKRCSELSSDVVLDLGAGTGKSLATFLEGSHVKMAVGCDFSGPMLGEAQKRLKDSAMLSICDFHRLAFLNETFDLVMGSFVLRSVQNLESFLDEAKRVLRRGGRVAFLELTRARNVFFRRLVYEPYVRFYVPWVGRWFSGHGPAYRFLSESVQYFMEPTDLKKAFERVGFREVSIHALSGGLATIVKGVK